MGGTTFTVKTEELRTLAASMSATADQLESFRDVRGDHSRELGDDGVADAVRGFFQHWSDGIDRMSEDVRGIADRLGKSADAYDEVDCSIVAAASTPAVETLA